MGKLITQPEPTINHFSHKHPLHLINHNPNQTLAPSSCSGCKVPLTQGLTYTCSLCNYYLHTKCSQMPQQIKHPSDQSHVFSLLTVPKYPEGVFRCDACGGKGSGFSYHCNECGTDLHILCASMPLSTTHHSHHHSLSLIFSPPYLNKSFSCDVCRKNGGSHWLYRCNVCEFDAHLGCGTSKAPPPHAHQAQAHQTAQMYQYQQTPSVSVPVVQPTGQVPGYMQQCSPGYMAAAGMPTPGRPLMDVTARMQPHLQQQTLGVPFPVAQPTAQVNPYSQRFSPGYRAPTPGAPQMNQQPFNFTNQMNTGVPAGSFYNPNTNAAFQMNNQGTAGFFPNARQDTGQQMFQGQMPARGGNNDTTLQVLQCLQAILEANNNAGGGVDANAQLIQALMNNGGGSADANAQLIQGLMGGGGGGGGGGGFDVSSLLGGGFDVSSLLGGGFDISSLTGLLGGFGLS